MAAAPTVPPVSVDEYMNTSYRPDVEFVDGVLVERHPYCLPPTAQRHTACLVSQLRKSIPHQGTGCPHSSTSKTSRRARRFCRRHVERSASEAYISLNRSCARTNWQR